MAKRLVSEAEYYFQQVADGEIVACKKIKRLAEIMLPRFKAGKYKDWHYDHKRAMRVVNFIERVCMLPSGEKAPFKLELYQKALLQTIFGWVDDDGYRQFWEVLDIMGRKNGKTSLLAAVELYMLTADGEFAPQVYNAASSVQQASLAYGAANRMMESSPRLSKRLRVGTVRARKTSGMIDNKTMGYITTLSGNNMHMDGLDIHCAVIDELAAIVNRDIYDQIKQAISSRNQPLILVITTNGFVRNSIFDSQYAYAEKWLDNPEIDDHFLPFVYELDERSEWRDERCWVKANPGLGTVKRESALRSNVEKAKNDPSFLPTLLTKDFNMPENQAQAWLSYVEAVNEATFDIHDGFRYCVIGFDAASTTDLCAARAMMMKKDDPHIYERSMYWMPEVTLELQNTSGKRVGRDRVPYDVWVERGLIRTVPGNRVPNTVLIDWIYELMNDGIYTFAVGYDPWNMDDRKEDLQRIIGKSRTFEVRQGAQTLSAPMKQLYAQFRDNLVVDNHNPVNEWCRMNTDVVRDSNDNIKPCKKLRNPQNRIDGLAAELDAYVALLNVERDYLNII